MYVNMKELKKHTILGFKIGGVLKQTVVWVHPLKNKIRWCFSSCFILWDDIQLSTLLEECWCVADTIYLIWEINLIKGKTTFPV
jgi:hypothetical protein